MRSDSRAQVPARGDGARVVDAGRFEVLAVISSSRASDALLQAVSGGSPARAVLDHLRDLG